MYAGQIHQLDHQIVSIGGQEVNLLPRFLGFVHHRLQLGDGGALLHARLCSHVGHAVHLSVPYDVLDVYVVAQQVFLIVVHIDDTHQTFAM